MQSGANILTVNTAMLITHDNIFESKYIWPSTYFFANGLWHQDFNDVTHAAEKHLVHSSLVCSSILLNKKKSLDFSVHTQSDTQHYHLRILTLLSKSGFDVRFSLQTIEMRIRNQMRLKFQCIRFGTWPFAIMNDQVNDVSMSKRLLQATQIQTAPQTYDLTQSCPRIVVVSKRTGRTAVHLRWRNCRLSDTY